MNQYDAYLTERLQELTELQKEIERVETPSYQLHRMREYYTKTREVTNYFQRYPDKGSGRTNYYDFLSAKGKYLARGGPAEQEQFVQALFENKVFSPPRSGRKQGYSPWSRQDGALYEAVKNYQLDYSSAGFFQQRG